MPKVPYINSFILLFYKNSKSHKCANVSRHISKKNKNKNVNNCSTFDTISCIIVSSELSTGSWCVGRFSKAAISARHFIKAEECNWSSAVSSRPTVLQWDCGAGGSPDYQTQTSAAGFPVQLPHRAFSFIFLSWRPPLSSVSGWLWATYCLCFFYLLSYIFMTQLIKLQIVPGLGGKNQTGAFNHLFLRLASGAVAHIHVIINIHVSQYYTNYP